MRARVCKLLSHMYRGTRGRRYSDEIHAQREGEEKKLADLQHKIAETQQELNARDADLQRLSVAMGQHSTSLGVSSADHYSGQEKLAKDKARQEQGGEHSC